MTEQEVAIIAMLSLGLGMALGAGIVLAVDTILWFFKSDNDDDF